MRKVSRKGRARRLMRSRARLQSSQSGVWIRTKKTSRISTWRACLSPTLRPSCRVADPPGIAVQDRNSPTRNHRTPPRASRHCRSSTPPALRLPTTVRLSSEHSASMATATPWVWPPRSTGPVGPSSSPWMPPKCGPATCPRAVPSRNKAPAKDPLWQRVGYSSLHVD